MPPHRADIRAIAMDADTGRVRHRILHHVDVVGGGADLRHLAGPQPVAPARQRRLPSGPGRYSVEISSPRNMPTRPQTVVVDRRALPRAPDQADHAEPFGRIAMQQVLPIGRALVRRRPAAASHPPRPARAAGRRPRSASAVRWPPASASRVMAWTKPRSRMSPDMSASPSVPQTARPPDKWKPRCPA